MTAVKQFMQTIVEYLSNSSWRGNRGMKRPENSVFYGGTGTIHHTTYVNVETHNGKVHSVWFRCCALPFDQTEVGIDRAAEMDRMYQDTVPPLVGVEIDDRDR